MSQKFDDQLRDALRPVDPDDGFADRVMARVQREPPQRRNLPRFRWIAAAVAASIAAGAIGVHDWQLRRERAGIEARRQLIEALRVTGEKLDVAYQAINRDSSREDNQGSGA